MMDILIQSIIVFTTQLVFIWARTVNVRQVADGNTAGVLISGGVVHITWLVGIAIGSNSVYKILNDFAMIHLWIVLSSLIGGIIGSWLGMKRKN